MCGFVAVISADMVAAEDLDRMRDRLAHRGPDDARSWIGKTPWGCVALGHRRLSIIDLSEAGAQPMFSPDGNFVIVFNGEIYNYQELRRELVALGVAFRSECDTEVLLQAYAYWGTECLPRLNGMFAFTIWDARSGQLFAARDRFGEKPFYYAHLPGGGIAMASEMKALFAHPDIDPVFQEKSLRTYAVGNPLIIGSQTLFDNVHRLPQATAMLIDGRGRIQKTWRYWTPNFEAIRPYRKRAAEAEFASLLRESVRLRLRSDVPLGACLSGGLDSSILVGMTAKLNGDGRYHGKTYSARFDDDPTISEGEHIDLMNRFVDAESHFVCPDPKRLIEESRTLHWYHEEPIFSASMYLEWCVMRLARMNNDIVLLNGQGADELLGGYLPYFIWLQYDWLQQARPLRMAVETMLSTFRHFREGQRYSDSKRRFDLHLRENMGLVLNWWRNDYDPAAANEQLDGVPSSSIGRTFRYCLAHGLLYSVLPQQLHSADRNAMAFGVETRFPFLDYRLVDWCVGLPDHALVNNGWQKYIMRRGMRGIIPRDIQWRVDKVGFAAPIDRWFRGPLKDWAYERLFKGPATQLSFYDRPVLERAWDDHQAGTSDQTWRLWPWVSINEWLSLTTEGDWKAGLPVSGREHKKAAVA